MKPILLIRPDHNQPDADALAEIGVDSVVRPLLEIVPAADPQPALQLAELLGRADPSTWLIVTSPRTWALWRGLVTDLDSLLADALDRGLTIATVGAATAASLPTSAQQRTVTPPGISGDDLLDFLVQRSGGTVLLPASARARRRLPDGLRKAGWQVHQAAIYDTVPRLDVRLPKLEDLGGVLVRSASAASALAGIEPELPAAFTVFAVGPITAARCRELGWQPVLIGSTKARSVAEAVRSHETMPHGSADGSMLDP